ncbi:hypothetical protein [Sphingomonas oleivorans]|nr:hypothetical protein [Sphingomonas oleivorans]
MLAISDGALAIQEVRRIADRLAQRRIQPAQHISNLKCNYDAKG